MLLRINGCCLDRAQRHLLARIQDGVNHLSGSQVVTIQPGPSLALVASGENGGLWARQTSCSGSSLAPAWHCHWPGCNFLTGDILGFARPRRCVSSCDNCNRTVRTWQEARRGAECTVDLLILWCWVEGRTWLTECRQTSFDGTCWETLAGCCDAGSRMKHRGINRNLVGVCSLADE